MQHIEFVQLLNMSNDEYGDNGYIGNTLCNQDGIFTSPVPTITINFSKSFNDLIPGITVTWSTVYNEWATKFRLTAYHNEQVVFVGDIQENTELGPVSMLSGDIRGYNKIVVQIYGWSSPLHRARIESIFMGIDKIYTKQEIMNYSATAFVDPMSAELPNSEINFEIVNLDGEYNPDNPHGVERYLMERQQVTSKYGYEITNPTTGIKDIEWIPGGVYYLSEWTTPQNGITATFTARDAIELMSDPYSGRKSGTFMEIVEDALNQADIIHYDIDDSLSDIIMPNNADVKWEDLSIAEVLQYIANASCCAFYQDRRGYINIKPFSLTDPTDYEINRFNSYKNSEISLSKQLKAVDINKGQFNLLAGLKGETQPVDNPFISDEQAPAVAKWVMDYLINRRNLSGDYRADPRLDPLDLITNENQFARSLVLVTEVKYTYNGAFRGSYQGKGVNKLNNKWYYSGDGLHAGQRYFYGYNYSNKVNN